MLNHEIKTIDLANLFINTANPRFDAVESQRDAIDVMVKEQKEKLINLAKDIVEEGLNPSELAIVTPTGNGYKVLEGNRRIVSLKLLNNPVLIKDKHKQIFKRLKILSATFKDNPLTSVPCAVFKKEEDATRWIKLKHTGENKGKGTVSWDAQQVARFESLTEQKSSVGLQALDFIIRSVDEQLAIKLKRASITNLERLLTDKNVQDVIGVRINEGILETDLMKEEVQKGLLKIVRDIAEGQIKVKDIYSKTERKKYIETFEPQKDVPNKKKIAEQPWQLDSYGKGLGAQPKKKRKAMPLSTDRTAIIPRDCILHIKDRKINAIYSELKDLNVDEYTNAGAILLRVFLELSVDAFCEQMKISLNDKKGDARTLNAKLTDVVAYMEKNGIATDKELKAVRVIAGAQHHLTSVNTFHAYVHSRHFQPDPKSIKISWENMQLFVERIWQNLP